MRRITITLTLLLIAAAAAPSQEVSSKDKKWLKACLDALKSETTEVREAAELSLARFGVDALPCVLDCVQRVRKDEVKEAIVRAVCGMGRETAVRRLRQIKMMDERKYGKKADTLLEWLGTDEPRPLDGVDPGRSPERVVDTIRDVLRDVKLKRQSGTVFVDKIVALGRDAIPELVRLIRRSGPDQFEDFMIRETICDAMSRLVGEEELPLLAALLSEGHLDVARCFGKLKSAAALTALLAPVKRGFVSDDLLEALERHQDDQVVVEALLAHLREHGRGDDGGIVAAWMAKAGVRAAVPVILEIARTATEHDRRVELAEALVRLGERTGIAMMIEVLGKPGKSAWDNQACYRAGEMLNWVAREKVFVGTSGGEKGPTGNFVEAARKFGEWWSANRGRLSFDERTRRWIVR